jgi:hypothetical protein
MANNNVASWTAGTILFGGKELHSVSAGSTADATPVGIGGNMVDHALAGAGRYIVFWEKANPSIFQTVLESAYVSDDDRIIVMELTGSATGGDVQIQSRDASHGASDKLNADSFNKIVAGTFASDALTGEGTGDGILFDSTALRTYQANGYITYKLLASDGSVRHYNGEGVDNAANTMLKITGTSFTYFNANGEGDANKTFQIVSSDSTDANNGLFIYGSATSPTSAAANQLTFDTNDTQKTLMGYWDHTGGVYSFIVYSNDRIYLQGDDIDLAPGSGGIVNIRGGTSGSGSSGSPNDKKTGFTLKSDTALFSTWQLPTVAATSGQVLTVSGTPGNSGTAAGTNTLPRTHILTWATPAASGDITNVIAGTGLNGGATSGAATLTVDAAQTVISTMFNTNLIVGAGASHGSINFATDNAIVMLIDGAQQVLLADGVLRPTSDSDVDLGTTSLRWKDAFVDSLTVTNSVLHSTATASGSVPTASYGTFQYASAATGGNVLGFLSGQDSATPAAATERSSFWTMFSEGDSSSNRLVMEPSVQYSSASGYDNYSYIGYHNYLYSISGYYLNAGDGSASFPSFAFSGDRNTGLYRISSGNIGISGDDTLRGQFGFHSQTIAPSSGSTTAYVSFSTLGNYGLWGASGASYFGHVLPAIDDFYDLGGSTLRFDDVRATNSTIQTSDVRLKEKINPSILGLDFVNDLNPISYKWKKKKENKLDQTHYGIIAQEVMGTLKKYGIDSVEGFGGITHDGGEEDYYGARYAEFVPILIKAVQELAVEIKELKEKN